MHRIQEDNKCPCATDGRPAERITWGAHVHRFEVPQNPLERESRMEIIVTSHANAIS